MVLRAGYFMTPYATAIFDLGLAAFRLLKLWRGGEKADQVLERAQSTGLDVTQTELDGFMKFLVGNGLTVSRGPEGRAATYTGPSPSPEGLVLSCT